MSSLVVFWVGVSYVVVMNWVGGLNTGMHAMALHTGSGLEGSFGVFLFYHVACGGVVLQAVTSIIVHATYIV